MTITIRLDTENAAFDDGNRDAEIARILIKAVEDNFRFTKLYDINGNAVGTITVRGK